MVLLSQSERFLKYLVLNRYTMKTIYNYISIDLQSSSQGQGCQYVISVKKSTCLHQQLVNYNGVQQGTLCCWLIYSPIQRQQRTCSAGPATRGLVL